MRLFLAFLIGFSCIHAQTVPSNEIGVSGGWSRQVGGYAFEPKQTAPGLGISYGHRFHGFIEAETGLFTAIDPTGKQCSEFGCVDIDDRFWWIPFGVRFVAPLYLGRIEFSGGGGGLYEKYTVGGPVPYGAPAGRAGWGGYFVASAAVSLDHSRRFWLAFTPRWFLANPPGPRDRWIQLSGEFRFRFR